MIEQDDIFAAIAAFNQRYLAFAQRLLRTDPEHGKRLLGLPDSMAAGIAMLTPAQISVLADQADVLCEFRADAMPGRA